VCTASLSAWLDRCLRRFGLFRTDAPSRFCRWTNFSADPEQEHFADGLAEDLITDLWIAGLPVIARNSTFVYKRRPVSVAQVGRELGVRYVIEGSVRKIDNRVRITAQLIDAATSTHVWADRYDRELTDIFAVQDEITREIVGALALRLTPGGDIGRL
jgi:adenylate cyclase